MEIENYRGDMMSEVTMQVLRTTCPCCHKPVQFAISSEDRLYKEDAKYYQERCDYLAKEIVRLKKVMDVIVTSKGR